MNTSQSPASIQVQHSNSHLKNEILKAEIKTEIERYLLGILSVVQRKDRIFSASRTSKKPIAEQVFEILTSRPFCYLSKIRSSRYAEQCIHSLNQAIGRDKPLPFYYDIGGGYHASIRPGQDELSYDVGLAELLIIFQIVSFISLIENIYPPGAKFNLVIDNVCAWLVNDISIEKTLFYCQSYRSLIDRLNLSKHVTLLVESEHFSPIDYSALDKRESDFSLNERLTLQDLGNVSRFLGRPCDSVEASERFSRYKRMSLSSERLLNTLIHGVHMTQRATDTTPCFRSFPGGDSRIQCGDVGITLNALGRLHPVLLTSTNIDHYLCYNINFPLLSSLALKHVTYAERVKS